MINEMQVTIGMLIGGVAALIAFLLVQRQLMKDAYKQGYDQCKEDVCKCVCEEVVYRLECKTDKENYKGL